MASETIEVFYKKAGRLAIDAVRAEGVPDDRELLSAAEVSGAIACLALAMAQLEYQLIDGMGLMGKASMETRLENLKMLMGLEMSLVQKFMERHKDSQVIEKLRQELREKRLLVDG